MYPSHAKRKTLLFTILSFTVLCVILEIFYTKILKRRYREVFQSIKCDIKLSTQDIQLKLHNKEIFELEVSNLNESDGTVFFLVQHDDIVKISPPNITLDKKKHIYKLTAEATSAGHSDVTANASSGLNVDSVYLRVTVYKSPGLDTFIVIIGWIYFVAWSISFYPQMYINFRRKSVIGLNFDFLSLNLVGFTLYSTFNLGLFLIPEIQDEYSRRHPRGLNPVQIQDVCFGVHATIATCFTIAQCFLYERAEQRVSLTARGILGIFGAFLGISLILSITKVLHWLDFLYFCSYVKLTITLIKYMPQAYMNYKRKSTVGWSIGNIILDFTGGTLSMLQMILQSFNYNDWVSIFGDPTKFGLGLFSVVFDIFFIIQHYFLYRHTNYEQNE